MKKTLALAIVLASIASFAQSETSTAPTAPAEATAPVAKSKVKKAKKKKNAKPGADASAVKAAPVAATALDKAPVAAAAPAAAPAAAAGTSTVAAADVAPTKKWGGQVKAYSTTDMNDLHNNQLLSTATLSYKVTEKTTLKASETFETLSVGDGVSDSPEKRDMVKQNNFRPSFMDLAVATKAPGILGAGEMATSLNFKSMGGDSVYTTIGGYAPAKNMIEANLSMPYSITPKVDVSVDSQWRHVINRAGPNSNRALIIPTVSYTVNDLFSVYQSAGGIFSMRDDTAFRRNYTRVYLETGVSITPSKSLSIGLDISQDKAVQSSNDKVDVTNFSPYSSHISANAATESDRQDRTLDAVAYEGTISYTF